MKTEKKNTPDFKTDIITPIFRLSYPAVWESRYNQLADREEYTIQMLFDKKTAKTELAAMLELMNKVMIHKWGAKPQGFMSPFKDGDLTAEKNPSGAGMIVLRSWSKNKPGIVNARREIIIDQDEIYGGCFCRAQLNCYAYEKGINKGVSFGLLNLQKVKDGSPFGNRVKAEDAFTSIEEAGTSEVMDTTDMFS